MKRFSTRMLCRAGLFAALYAVLTVSLGELSYGPIQIRLAEGLTLLPLLFAESVPALFVGCLIANFLSPYGIWDIAVGSLVTLIAAVCTYYTGKRLKNKPLKLIVGGLFPVLLNALILPLVWYLMGTEVGYAVNFLSILGTQALWVYGIGVPLYFLLERVFRRAKSPAAAPKDADNFPPNEPLE